MTYRRSSQHGVQNTEGSRETSYSKAGAGAEGRQSLSAQVRPPSRTSSPGLANAPKTATSDKPQISAPETAHTSVSNPFGFPSLTQTSNTSSTTNSSGLFPAKPLENYAPLTGPGNPPFSFNNPPMSSGLFSYLNSSSPGPSSSLRPPSPRPSLGSGIPEASIKAVPLFNFGISNSTTKESGGLKNITAPPKFMFSTSTGENEESGSGTSTPRSTQK